VRPNVHLRQQLTRADAQSNSGLTPTSDIDRLTCDVRFVPRAIGESAGSPQFTHIENRAQSMLSGRLISGCVKNFSLHVLAFIVDLVGFCHWSKLAASPNHDKGDHVMAKVIVIMLKPSVKRV
jgi:hypothetical protein